MGFVKNFQYGELWESSKKPERVKTGKETVDPAELTTNQAFLDFLRTADYRVVLDYGYPNYAHTDPARREIVLNGNYSHEVLSSLLKHELGHLMLFDVNQFTTVRPQTLRSAIAKEIYTPNNLTRYGLEQLLWGENVIQDIIIETVSDSNCVCHNLLREMGSNAGVKHLANLESPAMIAREVVSTQLVDREEWGARASHSDLEKLLGAMLEQLEKDLSEARAELGKMRDSSSWLNREVLKRKSKKARLEKDLEKLEKKIKKVQERAGGSEAAAKLGALRDRLREELKSLNHGAREAAEAAKARAMRALEGKIERAEKLKEALEAEGESLEAGSEAGSQGGEAGEGQGGGDPVQGVDGEISANLTDHLGGDESSGSTHTFDCGLPLSVSVSREESVERERSLRKVDSRLRVRRVELDENVEGGVEGRGKKSLDKELTYFRNGKREFDAADMLRGKRKKFETGIGVMIGLDVSGSMSEEWSSMFEELSSLVEDLRESLDIENVVYFTYDTVVKEWSDKIEDLTLQACGGNAFGYVYQDLMQKVPVLQKNEIILVTDCGDNLGWKLNDSCTVRRRGVDVENHVSVIDTEGAGFYDKAGFNDDDWSLYHKGDPGLFKEIQRNLEVLISR